MKLVMNLLRYIGIIIYYLPLEHISKNSVIINLLITFLKTATIPTYQRISIPFPRYIFSRLYLNFIHVLATLAEAYICIHHDSFIFFMLSTFLKCERSSILLVK